MDRRLMRQIETMIRSATSRIVNLAARGVVQLANDAKKLQILQLGVLDEEPVDDAEHHQAYGFSSVPLAGAEAVVIFPNGDRSHPLVVSVSDRRHRPTGGAPGEVTIYHHAGARVKLLNNGDVVVSAKSGSDVLIDDGSGGTEPLVKRSEFNAHTHNVATTGTAAAQTGTAAAPASITGTTVLQAK